MWYRSLAALVICAGLWGQGQALWACSAQVIPVDAMVEGSDVIVRARVVSSTPDQGNDWGSIQLEVLDVLKGDWKGGPLVVEGEIRDYPPRPSPHPVPYDMLDCSRAAGCGGCFAYDYKEGAEYLLFLKEGNPYWAPLSPTNEEVSGLDDPWVLWVKNVLAEQEEQAYRARQAAEQQEADLEQAQLRRWKACSTDADCVVVPGVCRGDLEGVNRTFQQGMEQWIAKKRPMVDCATDFAAKPGEPPVRCLQGLCEAQYELVPIDEAR